MKPRAELLGRLLLLLVLLVPVFAAGPAFNRTPDESRRAMESIMGPFPDGPRGALDVQVLNEFRHDGLVFQDLTYLAAPGSRVPAHLVFAESSAADGRRHPGVLALHQTHPAGRNVVIGRGQSPDDEYGVELARRGYVVLAPPYTMLADYHPDVRALGFRSGTMLSVWNNSRGLDLLASLSFVSTNGFASIGHSLGGHNGLFTAAFDPRLRVVVTSCGFDSFRDYYDGNPDVWAPERGWCQLRYMPGLAAYRGRLDQLPFDFTDVLGAIAPRAVFVNAPMGDSNFRWRSVDRVVADVRPRWEKAGRGDRLVVVHPDCPHRFPPAERRQAYEFIDRELGWRP